MFYQYLAFVISLSPSLTFNFYFIYFNVVSINNICNVLSLKKPLKITS